MLNEIYYMSVWNLSMKLEHQMKFCDTPEDNVMVYVIFRLSICYVCFCGCEELVFVCVV